MIVRIIGLLYRAPLTAIIGDEGNGYYGTAYNIYTILLMISSYSIPSAVSKLMAQKLAVGENGNAQRIFHCALFYGLIVGVGASALLFFGAGLLVPRVAENVLRVFAPTVFLFGILAALDGTWLNHNIALIVNDCVELLGGQSQQIANLVGQAAEIPDVGNGQYQFDVSAALTAHLLLGHLNTTTVAHDTLVADALVLTTGALIVLGRTEDTLTEQTAALGLVCTIVDGLRLRNLAK